MQAISPRPPRAAGRARNLGYFLIPPIVGLTLLAVLLALGLTAYRARYSGRVYTGVSVAGIDLSKKTSTEAEAVLGEALPYAGAATVTLVDPGTGEEWGFTPAQLGVSVDTAATTAAAFDVGRSGGPLRRLQDSFQSWYYGRTIAPIVVFDESQLDRVVAGLSETVERNAVSASWQPNDSGAPAYVPAQIGRSIDRAYLREQLMQPIRAEADARVELLVHDIYPPVYDTTETTEQLVGLYSEPIHFYFQQPLDDFDLSGVTLPAEELARWVRVEQVEGQTATASTASRSMRMPPATGWRSSAHSSTASRSTPATTSTTTRASWFSSRRTSMGASWMWKRRCSVLWPS